MDRAEKVLNNLPSDDLKSFRRVGDNVLEFQYNADNDKIANLLEMLVSSGARIVEFDKVQKDIAKIYEEIINE